MAPLRPLSGAPAARTSTRNQSGPWRPIRLSGSLRAQELAGEGRDRERRGRARRDVRLAGDGEGLLHRSPQLLRWPPPPAAEDGRAPESGCCPENRPAGPVAPSPWSG